MKAIELYRDDLARSWVAIFFGDPDIRRLFGTDRLPTAFSPSAPAAQVLAAVQEQNPGCHVYISGDEPEGCDD